MSSHTAAMGPELTGLEGQASNRARLWSICLAGAAGVVAILTLTGYVLNLPGAVTVMGLRGMAPLTATGILFLSAAVFLPRRFQVLRSLLLLLAAIPAALVLGSQIFFSSDKVNPWLGRVLGSQLASSQGMSAATAGMVLLLTGASWWRVARPTISDMCSGLTVAISGVALLGYAYGVSDLYALPMFNTMALNTACALFLLAFGSMLSVPNSGWAATIASPTPGGRATRRQLAFTIIPPLAGWMLLQATEHSRVGLGAAMALLVILTIAPLAILVLRDGKVLIALDRARAEKTELQASHEQEMAERLASQAAELSSAQKGQEVALAALHNAKRLESVGQLTGGIAHDFNNLLMAISGNLQLLRRRTPEDDPNRRFVDKALVATTKGAKVTGQLLAFSRAQKLTIRPVAVRPVVDSAVAAIRENLGPSIDIRVHQLEEDVWASADPDQLELAMLNLALNARDAMPGGGRLVIRTSVTLDRVLIQIEDTGTGMPPEVLEKAVEPFFTTKEQGKGTGLGLAQAYGFARQCGGDLRIRSVVDKGTAVDISLPLAAETAATKKQLIEPMQYTSRQPAMSEVLVIDDDDEVRAVIVQTLKDVGFDVAQASDGYEGLAALARRRPVAAVIDFLMPGMNGAEVARQAQLRYPDLPIVFVSGYSDTLALDGIAGAVVLRKPFDVDGLNRALASVLN